VLCRVELMLHSTIYRILRDERIHPYRFSTVQRKMIQNIVLNFDARCCGNITGMIDFAFKYYLQMNLYLRENY